MHKWFLKIKAIFLQVATEDLSFFAVFNVQFFTTFNQYWMDKDERALVKMGLPNDYFQY